MCCGECWGVLVWCIRKVGVRMGLLDTDVDEDDDSKVGLD